MSIVSWQPARRGRLGGARRGSFSTVRPLPLLIETAEHEKLRREVGRWARAEIAPFAHPWDEQGGFPRELYPRAAEVGMLGLGYPETYGGAGGDLSHVLA